MDPTNYPYNNLEVDLIGVVSLLASVTLVRLGWRQFSSTAHEIGIILALAAGAAWLAPLVSYLSQLEVHQDAQFWPTWLKWRGLLLMVSPLVVIVFMAGVMKPDRLLRGERLKWRLRVLRRQLSK